VGVTPPPPKRSVKGPVFLFEMPRLTACRRRWSRALRPRQGARSCSECAAAFWAWVASCVMPGELAARSPCRSFSCTVSLSDERSRCAMTAGLLKLASLPLQSARCICRVDPRLQMAVGSLCAHRSSRQRRWLVSRWQRHWTLVWHDVLATISKKLRCMDSEALDWRSMTIARDRQRLRHPRVRSSDGSPCRVAGVHESVRTECVVVDVA